jgi:hypothetical protein
VDLLRHVARYLVDEGAQVLRHCSLASPSGASRGRAPSS